MRSSRLPEHWKAGTAPNASPDHHRQPEREGEHHAVEARLVEPHDVARHQRRHSVENDDSGGEPQRAAAQAQHHALGQELAHDPSPAGAQRRADYQRALATHSPYQQQSGHVDAGDQQDERGGRGQRGQGGTVLVDHLLPERDHPDAVLRIAGRTSTRAPGREPAGGAFHALQDAADLGGGLSRRDALSEPSQHDGCPVGVRHEGSPHLLPGAGKIETLRKHAHHGATLAADIDDCADDVRVRTEASGPGAVAQQHDPVGTPLRFLVGKEPAESRRRPEQPQQRWRDRHAPWPCAVRARPWKEGALMRGELLERLGLVLHLRHRPGAEVHGRSRHLSGLLADAYDALAVRVRQGANQQPVDDPEHRRVGAPMPIASTKSSVAENPDSFPWRGQNAACPAPGRRASAAHEACYSKRSVFIGSTRAARRAGNQQATSATATTTRGAAMNVSGSSVSTPYRNCRWPATICDTDTGAADYAATASRPPHVKLMGTIA